MDSYEGAPDDPLSLHKYLYCQANPIDHVDPSGHDLGSTMAAMAIDSIVSGLGISAVSRVYDAAMQFRAGMDLGNIVEDAALGMGEDALINVATLGLGKISALRKAGQAVKRATSSVWNLGWGARGKKIEGLVAKVLGKSELSIRGVPSNNVPSFKTIDDFTEGVARSVKSIDLTGKTYQDAAALTKKLSGYADQLANFKYCEMGGVSVSASEINERILTVAFEPGAATFEQLKALEALVRDAPSKFKGVKIHLVPIK